MIIWCELFGKSELLNMSEFPTSCTCGGDDSPFFYMYAM
nr:MAG TPA: hypothetical protein [Caudoviricetes sp.]